MYFIMCKLYLNFKKMAQARKGMHLAPVTEKPRGMASGLP